MLTSAARAPAASGAVARRARRPSWRRSPHSPEGRPRKVKLVPLKGFRKREIARGAKRWLAPGSEVLTDGLRCWNALDGVVGSHRAIRTGSGRQAARMAPFKWVNTTLGNIKSAITGTYRKLGPNHAQRYLASFAWRYNRRYQLNTMIPRFVHSAARTQPIPIPSAHRWMTFMDKQDEFSTLTGARRKRLVCVGSIAGDRSLRGPVRIGLPVPQLGRGTVGRTGPACRQAGYSRRGRLPRHGGQFTAQCGTPYGPG